MRLMSFTVAGRPSFGVAIGDGVVDLGRRLSGRAASLKAFLAAGPALMAEARAMARPETVDHKLAAVRFLPVIPDPGKIVCVGLNYRDHVAEAAGRDVTEKPVIFARFAESQTGHLEPLIKPCASDKFDYEGEMAVIIGAAGRHISEAAALGHVAGYACYNEGSVRDWQRHTHQYTPGKNFAATGGFGPWMVTADEIPDPSRLTLTTRLNGEVVQQSGTELMIFPIPEVIAYVSTFTPLAPGDVILTGTPGGVGSRRTPPVWLKAGDRVEVEISGIGTLVNTVAAEA